MVVGKDSADGGRVEVDVDAPSWDADLVDGTVRWHRRD